MKKLFLLITTILCLLFLSACAQKTAAPQPTQCPHEWELIRIIDASCIEDGHQDFRCTLCGETYTISTDKATGHTPKFTHATTIKAASCSSPGEGEQECATCGEKYKVTIPKKDHNYKNHVCTLCGEADRPMFFTDLKDEKKSGDVIVFSANFHNYSGKKLKFVEVTVELMDSKGNIIDTEWTYAVGSEGIKDKASAHFDLWYSGVSYSDIKSWSLAVKDYDVAG